jgi:hypothetical protein
LVQQRYSAAIAAAKTKKPDLITQAFLWMQSSGGAGDQSLATVFFAKSSFTLLPTAQVGAASDS